MPLCATSSRMGFICGSMFGLGSSVALIRIEPLAHTRALARYNRGWRPLLAMWSTVAACETENTWTNDGEELIWLDYRCCDDGHGHMVNCGDLFARRRE